MLEAGRKQVRLDVVHANERNPTRHRETLRELQAHEERADEPRADRRGHGVDRVHGSAGFLEEFFEDFGEKRDVRPRRVLRDHATIRDMHVLGSHHVGDQLAVVQQRDARVVTRGFDS